MNKKSKYKNCTFNKNYYI